MVILLMVFVLTNDVLKQFSRDADEQAGRDK
jgi:hypothetical protein